MGSSRALVSSNRFTKLQQLLAAWPQHGHRHPLPRQSHISRQSSLPYHVSSQRSLVAGVHGEASAAAVVVRLSPCCCLHSNALDSSAASSSSSSSAAAAAAAAMGSTVVALPPSIGRQIPERGSSFRSSCELGEVVVQFEAGKLAPLASGAVVATIADTKVLATAVSSHLINDSQSFLPLMVEYREKQYAIGRIPNTFMRREGAPKEREILCSRIIDRSIRPLFPKGYFYDTQVTANVLCSDQEVDPDILALNAASAALSISDIPWNGPLGAVRIGRIDGQLVVNPSMTQLVNSDINVVYAATRDKTLMIETQAREVSNADLITALKLAHSEVSKLIEPQLELVRLVQQPKRDFHFVSLPPSFVDKVQSMAGDAVAAVLTNPAYCKQDRGKALGEVEEAVAARLREQAAEERRVEEGVVEGGREEGGEALQEVALLPMAMEKIKREVIKKAVLDKASRVDGRSISEVRSLSCETGLLPPVHGSSLFARGNTQVLCTVTLGPPDDAQRLDGLVGPQQKRFMVHYSFPSFSINEVRSERGGLNRREVGHGTLAEKALVALLPPEDNFPYSVRVTSEVLGSDGSSSMATVCGGSLALMDAGINMRGHVAGVSIGLITDSDPSTNEITQYSLLTDILGLEDYLGDMDFKIAGTRSGITAIQLDIKLPGVPLKILCEALEPALTAREKILSHMEEVLAAPRVEFRPNAPRAGTVSIDRESIGRLIGPQGSVIKNIQRVTGSRVSVADDGTVSIFARDRGSLESTKEMVESTVGKEVEVGQVYSGTVSFIRDFGAFVELDNGREGLLHISEIEHRRIGRVDDVLSVGQKIEVKCVSRDLRGNVKLSRKALLPLPSPSDSDEASFSPSSSSLSSAAGEATPLVYSPPTPRWRSVGRREADSGLEALQAAVREESMRERVGEQSRSGDESSSKQEAEGKEMRASQSLTEDSDSWVRVVGGDGDEKQMGSAGAEASRRPREPRGTLKRRHNAPKVMAVEQGEGGPSDGGGTKLSFVGNSDEQVAPAVGGHAADGSRGEGGRGKGQVEVGKEYTAVVKEAREKGAVIIVEDNVEGIVHYEDASVLHVVEDGDVQKWRDVVVKCVQAPSGRRRAKFVLVRDN